MTDRHDADQRLEDREASAGPTAEEHRADGPAPKPGPTPHRPDDVPEAVKPESRDPENPADIGGAQAEPNGIWRVLRNSAILAVGALLLVYVVMQFA